MVSHSHLIKMLHNILDDAAEPADNPVVILTAETRDTWYQAKQKRLQDLQHIVLRLRCNQHGVV